MRTRNLFYLMFLCILSGMALQGCGGGNAGSSTPPAGLNLSSSKQGLTVGIADVNGDGLPDKLVGAPYAAVSADTTGAVLVYRGTAAGFDSIPSTLLTGDDNFGYSFCNVGADFAVAAIHGDGDDVSLSGNVTIYKGGGNGQVVKKLSGEWPLDKFGYALASGDLNGDGVPDLVVGAPFNTNNPTYYQGGAVYVFFGPDYTTGAKLYASSSTSGLGWAVSTGDVNADGTDDLVIMATGKVLVFYGNPAGFAPSIAAPDFTFSSAAAGFGKAIAVVGDVAGSGRKAIAIGAPNAVLALNTVSSRDVGSVYVVSTITGTQANLDTAATGTSGPFITRLDGETLFSRFGSSITALGDSDGGGKPDFAVGAPMRDVATNAGANILSGAVYVFKGEDIAAGAPWANTVESTGLVMNQAYGTSLASVVLSGPTGTMSALLIGAPRSHADTGGAAMVNPATGVSVAGGSSGGSGGDSGSCH